MARISVKNMSRKQQKAVFANLGNKPSTVSNMNARRESLMHNDLATENQQDKIDRIMRDGRLTHRQKMDRIARVKSGKHSSGSSDSGVPISSKASHVDAPAVKLIYQKTLAKAEERRLQRKAYREKHPGAVFEPTKKPGVYLLKEHGETFRFIDGKKIAPTMKQNIAAARRMSAKAHRKRQQEKTNSMQGRSNLYKDAYATKGEAEGIKDMLEHEGNRDVIIFTDKGGDWNIAYNKKSDTWNAQTKVLAFAEAAKKPSKQSLYLVKFVNKDTKQKSFKEISARSKKDARKILLSQQKNVGIVSIHEKTAQAGLLEKKLSARKQTASERHKELMKTTTQTEYRVHYEGSIQGHYVIAKNKEMAKNIVAEQYGYTNKGLLTAVPWKTWKGGKVTVIKKDTARKQYRVGMILPGIGREKDTVVKSDLMTKKKAESLALKKRKLGWDTARAYEVKKKKDQSYKELKASGIKLKPGSDYDGDGVKNSKDCRPMNKNKQDLFDQAVSFGYSAGKAGAKAGTKFAQKKLYEHSAKGKAEKAQRKIRNIEAKERAEKFNKEQKIKAVRLEKEAKQKEAQYKKEHPSIFTRVSKSIKERRAKKKSIYE